MPFTRAVDSVANAADQTPVVTRHNIGRAFQRLHLCYAMLTQKRVDVLTRDRRDSKV